MGYILTLGILILEFLPDLVAWQTPAKLDYESHVCKRNCQSDRNSPMTCEYSFTIEHYQTLSRACYDCPVNASDCHRPHCIPADGYVRAIKVVNRMMPGPALHVCKDDIVIVNVYNQLHDFEGTSIHWHGILQDGTPHMDGAAMTSQCPIASDSVFQYKFQVKDSGTHYWHAHSGLQRGDGIFGALIVRENARTPVMELYDYDLSEHTIIVQDWLQQFTLSKYLLHNYGNLDDRPSSILINGKGSTIPYNVTLLVRHGQRSMESNDSLTNTTESASGRLTNTDDIIAGSRNHNHGNTPQGSKMTTMNDEHAMSQAIIPHSVFSVLKGKRYRLRIISNGILNCPFKISIERHTLTVISSDGSDMQPLEVESLTILAGERYDVVLVANQDVGNYWMHVTGLGDCEYNGLSQTAIIRYHGAEETLPMTGNTYTDGNRRGTNANPVLLTNDSVSVAQMSSAGEPNEVLTTQDVKTFYMLLGYNEVENHKFFDSDYYPLEKMIEKHKTLSHARHMYALQLNYITHQMPMTPLLTQYSDIAEEKFCNESSIQRNCRREFCECIHRIKVALGDVIDMVLVSDGKYGIGHHPMHLHGHKFYVLGMEQFGNTTTKAGIQARDVAGKLQRNLRNPIQKDTVLVPDGGYTIIRFRATNLGFWLFHCHNEFHMSLGMSAVLQVGELHEMLSTPINIPRCGSCSYPNEISGYKQCTNNAHAIWQQSVYYMTIMLHILSVICRCKH